MQVLAAMVEFALLRDGHDVHLVGNPECVVDRISCHHPGARERGVLYVACEQVRPAAFPLNGKASVICWPEGSSATEALAATYDALRTAETWASSLGEALLRGATLDDFMTLGRDMLGCAIAYFDCNLIVLASSDDYWLSSGLLEGEDEGLSVEGQIPSRRATGLVEDLDYLHAAEIHGGFYYEDAFNRMFYGVNTFDGDEYLARLVITLPAGVKRLHRGQEQLIDVYHARLDDLFLRFAGNAGIISAQHDSLHVLARSVILDADTVDAEDATSVLRSYGWSAQDEYVVAKLVFFEGVHWDTVSLYLCGLLERTIGNNCAFSTDREIVWVANLTRAARGEETSDQVMKRFIKALVAMLREYACKAGVSGRYSNFLLGRGSYLEAGYALKYGQVRDPHFWYYRFEDYLLDYLLVQSAGELSAMQVCHPALAALRAHDAEQGTDFARTLVCFLRNNQNTTQSAEELFIHRTSLMRRMAQIKVIAPVDLDDQDQVLHLLISAKLLGI